MSEATSPAPRAVWRRVLPSRVSTWLMTGWTAFVAVWIIGGVATRPSKDCVPGDQLCQDASDAGTGIGVGLILVLWFIVFVVLALVALLTRKPQA